MLLIENGYLIDPKSGKSGKYDVLIEDKKIMKIGTDLRNSGDCPAAAGLDVIDAAGKVVAPGLVDVHVHFRDPGFTYKEDIETGAKAAAKGGFTTVVLMANTKPAVDNEETLRYVIEKGATTAIHVETCATVTKGLKGQEMTPMSQLKEAGAVGFTDDGIPLMDAEILRQAMLQAKELQVPISLHEENPSLITNNGVNRGKASEHYGIGGSPREAEIDLIARDLQIALETGAQVNMQHLSSKESIELIREARKKGSNIHGEATPHHFTLTEEAVITHGTLAKMNPPLREEADRQAIIQGLKDGTIDMIATDHAPHSSEEKAKSITEAPSGIIGLETALALGITELVDKHGMSLSRLLEKMSLNPAGLYGLNAGYLEEDGPADLIIFDPKQEWVVENMVSKSQNTPFLGQTLKGMVHYTICDGKIAYQLPLQ